MHMSVNWVISAYENGFWSVEQTSVKYITKCKHFLWHMMTSSNGNIFRVTGPLCGEFIGPGEFPTQRPVTRSFDVFFDLRLNKRLSKQPWGWWFEKPSWSLWRQCNEIVICQWSLQNGGHFYCLDVLINSRKPMYDNSFISSTGKSSKDWSWLSYNYTYIVMRDVKCTWKNVGMNK